MERHELTRAAAVNSALERAEYNLEALSGYKVTGIMIDKGDGSLNRITLERGRSGTGSISSIGYSQDLQAEMTAALHAHFTSKVETARAELAKLGINIAA